MWNRNFILLTGANFLMCVTYYAIISTLPIYLSDNLHAGKNDIGIVLASYTIASVLIRPFGGYSLDRYGRRTIYLLALACYAFFFCGYLVAESIPMLILLRVFQGLSWGISTIAGSTIAVDFIPSEKRGEGIGYFAISTTLGMSFGPVAGLFACHHFGYTIMFISGIAVNIASIICGSLVKFPALPPKSIDFTWKNVFDRKSLLPSLNLFVIMTTYGGLLSFIALYGREIGVTNTSLFFMFFSAGIVFSRLLAGKSFDKSGPRTLLTTNLSCLIIGYILLVSFKNMYGYFISSMIIGYGIGVVFPVFQAIVVNLADADRRGAANSTLYTALDLGMGLGMVMMGYVAQYFNISATFWTSSCITLIGLLLFLRFVSPYYNKHYKN
jgi:MFS family permease